MFDLLVKNGTVIDPVCDRNGRFDVAIRSGLIAAVEPRIDAPALQTIDASGKLVTPGLIDLHTHVYDKGTFLGMDPDPVAARTGVTTWIDAGSAGAFNFAALRAHVIERAQVRILAFMNIVGIGLVAQDFEAGEIRWCSADLLAEVARKNADLVVGVKFRSGRAGGAHDLEPLRRAKRAATLLGKPLMVHISRQPPALHEVLDVMGPGDIVTHAFTKLDMKLLAEDGRLLDVARRAIDSGVRLDVGHGSGSFCWESAEKLVAQGVWPDTISSDLHQVALYGRHRRGLHTDDSALGPFDDGHDAAGMLFTYEEGAQRPFSLLECVVKFLHLGMPLPEAIRAVTATPATIIERSSQLGALKPGMAADLAVLSFEEGPEYDLQDAKGLFRKVRLRLTCDHTILAGRPMPKVDYPQSSPWVVAVEALGSSGAGSS